MDKKLPVLGFLPQTYTMGFPLEHAGGSAL